MSAADLRAAHAVHPIAALQSEWSIWTRGIESVIVPAAADLGIGIVPFSPLGRGFLTGTVRSAADLGESDFRRTMPRFTGAALDANQAVVTAVKTVAGEIGATPAQVALAWLRQRADELGVTAVPIPGTRRAARVDENLGSLSVTLTPAQVAALGEAGRAVTGARYADMSAVGSDRE